MFDLCLQKLGWLGYCQTVLPSQRTELTIVDYLGYTWKITMDFCHDEGVSCIFTRQWQALAEARKFTPHHVIRLGVTGDDNNKVMYLCAPPMLVLRKTIQPSAGAAEGGATYQVGEFFWRN